MPRHRIPAAVASHPDSQTRCLPRARPTSSVRESTLGLPPDVVKQSNARLRILALLYAFVFAMAGYVPALLLPANRAQLFSSFMLWGPGVIAIAMALTVAAVIGRASVPASTATTVGLVFEVVSSYGIATAEFLDPAGLNPQIRWFGHSWVAVWTLLFKVAIPSPPRRAVMAALASVSAVPDVLSV